MQTKLPHSFLVHDSLAIELKFISDTDNGIKFEFQCQMNRRKMSGLTKQNFSSKLAFD